MSGDCLDLRHPSNTNAYEGNQLQARVDAGCALPYMQYSHHIRSAEVGQVSLWICRPTMYSLLLFFDFLPSNQQAGAELMLLANLAQLIKDLQSQFPGWGDDKGP